MEKDEGIFISNEILDKELRDGALISSIILYKERVVFDFFGLAERLKKDTKAIDKMLHDTLDLKNKYTIEEETPTEEQPLVSIKYIYEIDEEEYNKFYLLHKLYGDGSF